MCWRGCGVPDASREYEIAETLYHQRLDRPLEGGQAGLAKPWEATAERGWE